MAIPSDIINPYNDPSLEAARQAADTAGTTYSNYQTAAALLPAKLRDAIQSKVDYNKDIIDAQNKAAATYFAAPATAREQYQNIWNPFTREKLVAEARSQAYVPYASLGDILKQRMGTLSDILNAGVGAFNAGVQGAGGLYQSARQRYSDLLDAAKNTSDLGKWWYEQTHAKPSSAGGTNDLSSILSLIGLSGIKGLSGTQTGGTPTEAQPLYTPMQGEGTPSQQGQWVFHNGEWMINSDNL